MKKLLFLICSLLPALLFSQQTQNHIAYGGENIGFLQHVPSSYNKANKYPLIIFLHGVGERGNGTTDLYKVAVNSVPKDLAAGNPMRFTVNGKTYEPIILSPQCSFKYGMWPDLYVDGLLQYAKATFNIDPTKVYLMGLSMGGGGTIKYASGSLNHANTFAAIATVCAPTVQYATCNIAQAKLPFWAFHAKDDNIVPVSAITTIVNSVLVCNPLYKPLMTVYPNGGHSVWTKAFDPYHTYQSPNVFEWMLAQTKGNPSTIPPPATTPPPAPPAANAVPIAVVKSPVNVVLPVNYAQLNGVGSRDADGYVAWLEWSKISGPASYTIDNKNKVFARLTNMSVGTYVFRLTLKDNKGGISYKDVTVNVTSKGTTGSPTTTPPPTNPTPGNQLPVAKAAADQLIHLPINSARLDGVASKDPDGYIAAVNWAKIAGPSSYSIDNPAAANAKVSNLVAGTYTFRLTVKDNDGAISYDDLVIRVNSRPVSVAGVNLTLRLPTSAITLNGSGSYDAEGALRSVLWTKISGPGSPKIANPSSAITQVTGLSTGLYVFRITTTDGDGASSYDETLVTVLKPLINIGLSTLEAPADSAVASTTSTTSSRYLKPGLNLYPNPAVSNINLSMNVAENGRAVIKIYDVAGRIVKTEFFNKDPMLTSRDIDISALKKGVYMLSITVGEKSLGTKQFLKK